jgi:hypothetical protein
MEKLPVRQLSEFSASELNKAPNVFDFLQALNTINDLISENEKLWEAVNDLRNTSEAYCANENCNIQEKHAPHILSKQQLK